MRNIWFEGDCIELDRVVNQVVLNHAQLGSIFDDLRHWMTRLPACSLASVNRERNRAANALSRHIFDEQADVLSFSVPPSWLINVLYWPYTL